MPPPPAKRKLIDLIKDDVSGRDDAGPGSSRAQKHDGESSSATDDDEEEDFMSDALLQSVEAATADADRVKKSGRQRTSNQPKYRLSEKESRSQGLARNLALPSSPSTASASSGGGEESKALRMMKSMGYEPGQAIGAQSRPDQASASTATSRSLVEPIRPDVRRTDPASRRAGIGALISSKILDLAESSAAASSSSDSVDAYRSRFSAQVSTAKINKTLNEAKRICRDLDLRVGIEYLPLWLQVEWFQRREEDLGPNERELVGKAMEEDEWPENDAAREEKTADGDSQAQAGRGGDGDDQEEARQDSNSSSIARPPPLSRRRETRIFLSLPVSSTFHATRDFRADPFPSHSLHSSTPNSPSSSRTCAISTFTASFAEQPTTTLAISIPTALARRRRITDC
ncbi:hypothetical protein BDZ90DRAFT_123395 [Jaminaea rosea]|uniref:G-patch domain-containing protein n=1 Tax=Jaminaea rosea TaxID=1569628 RepID=A0A316UGM2_9BASI|nr:hypothetical protein BDZ90DRAFT_123395 [Jaminaea rosea]PWN24406.1 hypothetical protein BDZ90DRAFT_123395 [Jaminaea rosea]